MQIFNLPDDSFPEHGAERIIFQDYTAHPGAFKGRGILQRHAISLVISGEKTMHFAERTVHARDDEFHFLSAGNCVVTMNLLGTTPFRSILIYFDHKTLSDFYLKYETLAKNTRLSKNDAPKPYLSFKKDAFITNFISSVSLLLQSSGKFSPEMRLLKFEELMLYVLEKYPSSLLSFREPGNRHPDDHVIRKAVETNITNNINVEELAFLCNMSLSTFKRRFIKLYDMPPTEWFVQQRMKLAKELLHHEKPSEIYYKVGYESHSSFSQAFRKTFGKSPKEFQSIR
jgi:AraC-like DNA-binding protein